MEAEKTPLMNPNPAISSVRIRALPPSAGAYHHLLPNLPTTADAEERFAHTITAICHRDDCEAFLAENAAGAGIGLALLETEGMAPGQAKAFVTVPAEQRRRGIGSALLTTLEDAARRQGRLSLQCYVRLREGTLPFALRNGWRETRRDMVQGVATGGSGRADPPPVAGVSVEIRLGPSLSRAEAEAVYGAYGDAGPAFAACVPLEDFIDRITQERPFNQVVVAWQGGQCVGMTWGQDAEPDAVFNEFTGVRPAFAGRGIATCLKQYLVQAAGQAGRPHLFTCNSPGNAAILAINRRLGYEPRFELAALEKEIG